MCKAMHDNCMYALSSFPTIVRFLDRSSPKWARTLTIARSSQDAGVSCNINFPCLAWHFVQHVEAWIVPAWCDVNYNSVRKEEGVLTRSVEAWWAPYAYFESNVHTIYGCIWISFIPDGSQMVLDRARGGVGDAMEPECWHRCPLPRGLELS